MRRYHIPNYVRRFGVYPGRSRIQEPRNALRLRWIVLPVVAAALVLAGWSVSAAQQEQAGSPASDREALERHLQRGVESLERGDLAAALRELQAAVSIDALDGRAQFHLGRAFLEAGRPGQAIDHLNVALSDADDAEAVQFVLAQAWLALDEIDRADAALQVVERSSADHPTVLYYRAMIEYRRGDTGAAIGYLDEAAEAEPAWVEPRIRAGEIALNAGETESAVKRFEDAVARDPEIVDSWVFLGDALAGNDATAAADAYRKAVELAPLRGDLRFLLARHLEDSKDHERAMAVYNDLLAREPDFAQARYHRARLIIRNGDLRRALSEVERAFGDLIRAIGDLESPPHGALSDLAQMRYIRADLLSKLGREGEAIEEARQVVAVASTFPEAHYLLGNLLIRQGFRQEGQQVLERFRQLSDAREQRQLGDDYLYRVRDAQRAERAYRAALQAWPEDHGSWLGLAVALRRNGNPEGALQALDMASGGAIDEEAWHRERFLALWAAGRRAEADEVWELSRRRGLNLGPEVWSRVRGRDESRPDAR